MASGRWITPAAERLRHVRGCALALRPARGWRLSFLCGLVAVAGWAASAQAADDCRQPLYLTFDTGHMAVAPLIADVLARHQVQVTFFAANEATQVGDGSLGDH